MYIHSYLQSAIEIIQVYKGTEPFSSFLKKYFSQHKKFGSKDRKQVSHLCYCYFRLGKALHSINVQERMLIALFLCSHEESPYLEILKPQWNAAITKEVNDKIKFLQPEFSFQMDEVLDLKEEISDQINYTLFTESFFVQPDLFLRIRPGHQLQVEKKLLAAEVSFQQITFDCLSLPPSTKIEDILQLNKEVVVQDINSQKVLQALLPFLQERKKKLSVWDCCAASGGKSLLLHDYFPKSQLTVSDIRNSILINLNKRFQQAGLWHYQSFVADVSAPDFTWPQQFDVIICDVPCTGSGTWSRTPEQLYFFSKEKISNYAALQKRIVQNAAKQLKSKGFLLYCTCSVFTKENEEVVDFIQNNLSLTLHSKHYLTGYQQKADTLFTALFIRS